ncbi:MAG: DUF4272 domain-containing protein [Chlorobia bacterium]|nr:DUF4272 domain-containing protein [Fimbriimonadaceae bacterium]
MKGKLGSFLQNLIPRPTPEADLVMIDPWDVRTHSIRRAEQLGYATNPNLPLLNKPSHMRSEDEVFQRMMCVFITSACAYGVEKKDGMDWLAKEGFSGALTSQESAFLKGDERNVETFKGRVEALYVLAWSLSFISRLDYHDAGEDDFIHIFPNLKTGQTAVKMRAKVKPRPVSKVFKHLDLTYCLHLAIVDAQIKGKRLPGDVHPAVVYHRRWALEWLLEADDWDNVQIDTQTNIPPDSPG